MDAGGAPLRTGGGEAVAVLIPYRNPKALAAYYLSFFALFPGIGILLAIVALVLGILGLHQVRVRPESRGAGHAWVGIVLAFFGLVFNSAISAVLWKLYLEPRF